MSVEYSSNNNGGKWWLTLQDWKNLEAAFRTVSLNTTNTAELSMRLVN